MRMSLAMRLAYLLVFAAVPCLSLAAKVDAVAAFQLKADHAYSDYTIGVLSMLAGDSAGLAEANGKMRVDSVAVDATVEAALRQAKGRTHLEQAIREFYQAATELYAAGIPSSPMEKARNERLRAVYEAKDKALALEVRLAK